MESVIGDVEVVGEAGVLHVVEKEKKQNVQARPNGQGSENRYDHYGGFGGTGRVKD